MLAKLSQLPFNIWLAQPTDKAVQFVGEVKVMDIYDNSGVNFHPDGLYSARIFGRVGSEERDTRFGYIRLNTVVFHPVVFEILKKLKGLYVEIMAGHEYAIFDEQEKDFVRADAITGQTGFSFFMKHWTRIVFKQTDSDLRKLRIELIEKYKKHALLDRYLIMPAGLRDLEVTENGQTREDEINGLYRKLLNASNTISSVFEGQEESVYDVPRWTMQRVAVEIYEQIIAMVKGKGGWVQKKWGSRKTINGTRNVITSMDTSSAWLDSEDTLGLEDTQIGFIQVLRGALPYTVNALKSGFLGDVFGADEGEVWLTNKKTLKRELVEVSTETYDRYATRPGYEKLINRFFMRDARSKPIVIEGYYLGLIYVDEQNFRLFQDIDDLPEHLSKKNVSPMTLSDLLYVSTIRNYRELVGTMTRYPVTGTGSTYPTYFKCRTTVATTTKIGFNEAWEPDEDLKVSNFPDRSKDAVWMDSLSPSPCRLVGLGGDNSVALAA